MQMEHPARFHSSLKRSGMLIAQVPGDRTDGSGVEPRQIMTQISYLDIVPWNVSNFFFENWSSAHFVWQRSDNTWHLSRTFFFPPKLFHIYYCFMPHHNPLEMEKVTHLAWKLEHRASDSQLRAASNDPLISPATTFLQFPLLLSFIF